MFKIPTYDEIEKKEMEISNQLKSDLDNKRKLISFNELDLTVNTIEKNYQSSKVVSSQNMNSSNESYQQNIELKKIIPVFNKPTTFNATNYYSNSLIVINPKQKYNPLIKFLKVI